MVATRSTSVEITGIVFYTGTVSQLANHFQIIGYTVFQSPRFKMLSERFEVFHLLDHVFLNFPDRLKQPVRACNENVSRKNSNLLIGNYSSSGNRINGGNFFYFITEKIETVCVSP